MALTSVEITDLMHGTIGMIAAVTISLDTASVQAKMILGALSVVLASIVIGILTNACYADLSGWTLDDFAIAVAAR